MKTIAELNQKWWYRLVKVVVVLTSIFFFLFTTENVIEQSSPRQSLNKFSSNVTCLSGDQSVHTFVELATTFSEMSLKTKILDSKLVAALCGIKDPFGDEIPRYSEIFSYMTREKTEQYLNNKELVDAWERDIQESYSVNEIYTETGSWFNVFIQILITLIGLVIFLEFIKRVFYYIVLGSIRPKKNESDSILPKI